VLADGEEQRVAAAREQAQERRVERVRLHVQGCDVPVQVVDRDEGQPLRPRDRLRGREADEERADEPGALRHGDALDVREARPRLGQRLAHDRRDELEVAPRRDLRHDAAVALVQQRLRRDHGREHAPALVEERGRGLVARRLEAEDHETFSGADSRHMISASSRLSV
jgi:hypothetical protein